MENILKMIRENVNLESYCLSDGYLGAFEQVGPYNESSLKKSSEIMSDYLVSSKIMLISSLIIGTKLRRIAKEHDLISSDFSHAINFLNTLKIVKKSQYFDSEEWCEDSKNIDEINNKLYKYENDFTIISFNSDITSDVLLYIMKYYFCCIGHIFILVEDKKLISYPLKYENGFGFISYDKKHKNMQNTLKKIFAENNFVFHPAFEKMGVKLSQQE